MRVRLEGERDEPKQHGIKDPWGGIPYILQYTAVWVKTRGTTVVKDGQTVEKTHCNWVSPRLQLYLWNRREQGWR